MLKVVVVLLLEKSFEVVFVVEEEAEVELAIISLVEDSHLMMINLKSTMITLLKTLFAKDVTKMVIMRKSVLQ